MLWLVLAACSTTPTNLFFQLPPLDQIRTRTPHRVCSLVVLGDVRRLIKRIVAIRPPAKPQVDHPGNQILEPPGVRPDQPRAHKPADDSRNRGNLAGRDQGQTADTHAATLQLPISTIATMQEEFIAAIQGLSAPRQGEVSFAPKQQEVSPVPRQLQPRMLETQSSVNITH